MRLLRFLLVACALMLVAPAAAALVPIGPPPSVMHYDDLRVWFSGVHAAASPFLLEGEYDHGAGSIARTSLVDGSSSSLEWRYGLHWGGFWMATTEPASFSVNIWGPAVLMQGVWVPHAPSEEGASGPLVGIVSYGSSASMGSFTGTLTIHDA